MGMKKELYENDKIEKLDSRFHGNDKIDVFSAISIHYLEIYFFFDINIHRYWRHSQVVRRRSAKPLFLGSNPGAASSRSGGIGRRKGLKIPRGQLRAGSSPATSTFV